jgi:uncharacterized membrane protein YecN with MAPEG domain
MIMLPITLTIAGAAALLNIWLGMRVSLLRRRHRVSIGHGGEGAIERRMRAHANFAEYTPAFLILLGLIELARGSQQWLWLVAIPFILGRIVHAFGMDGAMRLRIAGMTVTWIALLVLAAYALALPYIEGSLTRTVTYA